MPRFHFDIMDDKDSLFNEEGVEFPNLAAMERDAVRAAGMMIGELAAFPREPWTMTIRNGPKTLATLTFTAR